MTFAALFACFLAILAFTADIIAIKPYVSLILKGQTKGLWRYTAALSVGFFVAIIFIKVPTVLEWGKGDFDYKTIFDTILHFFSVTYLLICCFTLIVSSTALKGEKEEGKVYLVYGFASLLSYLFSIILILILPKEKTLHFFSIFFFAVSVFQLFLLLGEYIIKRYLLLSGEPLNTKFGEFKAFFKSITINLDLDQGNIQDDDSWKNFGLDCAMLIFTMTLGLVIMLVEYAKGLAVS